MTAQEQNYWPGFVDALSNVVLTLIFVLVVFVFALVIASNKVEKKAMEMVAVANEQNVGMNKVVALKEALNDARAKIKELKEENELAKKSKQDLIVQEKAIEKRFVSSKIGKQLKSNFIVLSKMKNKIVLTYPQDIAALDEKALKEFDDVLTSVKKITSINKVILKSFIGNENYSSARRLAYYRILNVRNKLISNNFVSNVNISSIIMKQRNKKDGRVEIIFKK